MLGSSIRGAFWESPGGQDILPQLGSVDHLSHARFSDTARRPFFVAILSSEQKEIERKLLVLALSRAYLVTGA